MRVKQNNLVVHLSSYFTYSYPGILFTLHFHKNTFIKNFLVTHADKNF